MPNQSVSIQNFEDYLRVERGLKELTIDGYKRDSIQFTKWLKKNTGKEKPSQASTDDLNSFKKHLLESGISKRTINKKLSSLKALYGFLVAREAIQENPYEKIELFSINSQHIPYVVDEEEMIRIIQSISTNTPRGIRDKAIVTALYATGVRVSELCGIKLDDIREDEIIVRAENAKRDKERIIPIANFLEDVLKQYLLIRHRLLGDGEDQGYLFFSGKNNDKLYPKYVERVLNKIEKNSGTKEKLHAHLFRHSIATHLLEREADLTSIQKLLGHSRIDTTEIYLHAKKEHFIRQIKNKHPLNAIESSNRSK